MVVCHFSVVLEQLGREPQSDSGVVGQDRAGRECGDGNDDGRMVDHGPREDRVAHMAKKKNKLPGVSPDQIRAAVEDALSNVVVRDRAQEVADEFVTAAAKVRELFEGSVDAAKSGLEAAESGLRAQLASLEKRIEVLEKAGLSQRVPAPTRKPAAKPAAAASTAAKPAAAAKKPAARKPAAKKPAASKPAAKKPAAKKPAAKKPAARTTAARKPAASRSTAAKKPAPKR